MLCLQSRLVGCYIRSWQWISSSGKSWAHVYRQRRVNSVRPACGMWLHSYAEKKQQKKTKLPLLQSTQHHGWNILMLRRDIHRPEVGLFSCNSLLRKPCTYIAHCGGTRKWKSLDGTWLLILREYCRDRITLGLVVLDFLHILPLKVTNVTVRVLRWVRPSNEKSPTT